jgi:hypothetical protein
MDHAPLIVDKMFVTPLIKQLQRRPETFAALVSLDSVDHQITWLFSLNTMLRSIDFSRYDQSISLDLIADVNWLFTDAFPQQYKSVIGQLFNNLSSSGMVTPEGWWTGRSGGIASGDGKTTSVGTLNQANIATNLGVHNMQLMGDDGVWDFSADDDTLEGVLSEYGLTVNPEKSAFSDSYVRYLQRSHHTNYRVNDVAVGVYPTMRALGKMLSFEYHKTGWSSELNTLRWIMQSENCKHHPMFRQFVEFWSQGDRDITVDVQRLLESAGGLKHVEEVTGKRAFPWLQGDFGSLDKFRTVRVLREILQ